MSVPGESRGLVVGEIDGYLVVRNLDEEDEMQQCAAEDSGTINQEPREL